MSWLPPFWAFGLPIAASLPIGWWMARALDPPADRAGRGLDALPMFLCRLLGRREPAQMDWKRYAVAMLAFNAVLFVLTFGLLYAQQHLPLNPDGKGSLGALGYKDATGVDHPGADTGVVFNTVCSFVTNTNLQHYSGEQHLSYFSQLGGIVWLQFVTPAVGLAVMLAAIRGLRGDKHLGDFYVDLMRSLVFVFVPLALVVAVFLIATGMPMTFQGAAQATPLDGTAAKMETQTIAAARWRRWWRSSSSGTNGGGFFGPNSAHPYREPDALEQSARDRLDRPLADGLDGHVRPDAQGPRPRGGGLRRDAGLAGRRRRRGGLRRGPAQRRDRGPAGRPRPQHGGQGGPQRPGVRRHLGGDDDGHLQRLGQQHARQSQPASPGSSRCRS